MVAAGEIRGYYAHPTTDMRGVSPFHVRNGRLPVWPLERGLAEGGGVDVDDPSFFLLSFDLF